MLVAGVRCFLTRDAADAKKVAHDMAVEVYHVARANLVDILLVIQMRVAVEVGDIFQRFDSDEIGPGRWKIEVSEVEGVQEAHFEQVRAIGARAVEAVVEVDWVH